MAEIKEYKLLTAPKPEQLTEQVQAHIKDGWQPFQSPSIFHITPSGFQIHMVYIQAVVKY